MQYRRVKASLPRALPDRPEPAAASPAAGPARGAGAAGDGQRSAACVLIVDDHAEAADTLADLLRLDGYRVEACYDEVQALGCAQRARPDIVVLDIALPERGGHALARELRALLPQALLIAFTGFSTSQDVDRSIQSGIDEHWVKPMSTTSFSLALAAARARHHARRAR